MWDTEDTELEIKCSELKVEDCQFVAHGETPAEIVDQLAEHLRSVHGIELPDRDEILEGRTFADRLMEGQLDKDAALVVTRLREKLGIVVEPEQDQPEMPSAGIVSAEGPVKKRSVTG